MKTLLRRTYNMEKPLLISGDEIGKPWNLWRLTDATGREPCKSGDGLLRGEHIVEMTHLGA
jgi:hypothetical protein